MTKNKNRYFKGTQVRSSGATSGECWKTSRIEKRRLSSCLPEKQAFTCTSSFRNLSDKYVFTTGTKTRGPLVFYVCTFTDLPVTRQGPSTASVTPRASVFSREVHDFIAVLLQV